MPSTIDLILRSAVRRVSRFETPPCGGSMRGREIEMKREPDEPYLDAVLMRNWRARVRMAFSRSVCVAGATAVSAQAPPAS
jgi:hypothetical protein